MREESRKQFMVQNGWGDALVAALPADASRRRYFRLTRPDGLETCLLMDMPRHPEERFEEFILLSSHLRSIGLSAPAVYASDAENGFALIEDFGEHTFTRLLNHGHDARELYETAIDALAHLQRQSAGASLPLLHYDVDAMLGEIGWFVEWYAPLFWQRPAEAQERDDFFAAVRQVFDGLPTIQPDLLMRDFHVDNFMWLPDRTGIQRCGILDFQDAKWGSPAYDLVSILQDARRDLDDALATDLYDRYLRARPDINPVDFAAHYAAMGMLRHARILGNFIRLAVRDHKEWYLQFMPRVQGQFENALRHPIAAPLRDWCARCLPDTKKSMAG